jgi:hypothetical protein
MNATLELVTTRGSIVRPRWFDASALGASTVAAGDWLVGSEAELHRPDQISARAGWGHAYREQAPICNNRNLRSFADASYEVSLVIAVGSNIVANCPYYGRGVNSTAAPFGLAVLNWGGSSQSDVYQMRGDQGASSASTEPVHIPLSPISTLVAELRELRRLSEGWDGEAAAAPIPDAINDALSFVRAAGDLSTRLEPTLHVDGSVILEVGDGSEGSLRFRGDHTITYAIRGFTPGVARYDGKTVPEEISATLAAVS